MPQSYSGKLFHMLGLIRSLDAFVFYRGERLLIHQQGTLIDHISVFCSRPMWYSNYFFTSANGHFLF